MAFIIPIRRFRPHTEPMLTHAKPGHWYLSQAWTKALTWVWNERPLSKIAVERPYGDHREYQEYWWSLDIQDWSGARETYTTGKKAAWEGLGGSAWGVHPFKDITLTITKNSSVSHWWHPKHAALPSPFGPGVTGSGVYTDGQSGLNVVFWALPTKEEASPMSFSVQLRFLQRHCKHASYASWQRFWVMRPDEE